MGQLYDLGYDKIRLSIGSFLLQWYELEDERKIEGRSEVNSAGEKLVMFTEKRRCNGAGSVDVSEDFRSEGYKELGIVMVWEKKYQGWYHAFTHPIRGIWGLRQISADR